MLEQGVNFQEWQVEYNDAGPLASEDMPRLFDSTCGKYLDVNNAFPVASMSTSLPPTRNATPAPSTASSLSSSERGRRHVELELMHQWCMSTCTSFIRKGDESSSQAQLWRTIVVQEGLKHDFLLSGILALSALHIAMTEHTTRSKQELSRYALIALEYHEEASKSFRYNLASLTVDNHFAAFVFSIINMGMTLALTHECGGVYQEESCIASVKTYFHMVQGLASIMDEAEHWLKAGPFGLDRANTERPTPDPDPKNLDSDAETSFAQILELNDRIHASGDSESQLRNQTNRDAVVLLKYCLLVWRDGEGNSLMMWPTQLPRSFLLALEQDDIVALLIVMHWGALLHRLRDAKWWIGQAGKSLVAEISQQLQARTPYSGSKFGDLSKWCRSQVGLSLLT